MGLLTVELIPLQKDDREQFILDNQRAFWYGARQEFGMQELLEETGIILRRVSRLKHLEEAWMSMAQAFRHR